MSSNESVLLFLSKNDPTKRETLNNMKRKIILTYLYESRVDKLNELLSANAQLRKLKEDAKKNA